MLETKRRPARAPEDCRMNLYHDTFRGRLRWYVKVNKTGSPHRHHGKIQHG
jgi:hypothetical protein